MNLAEVRLLVDVTGWCRRGSPVSRSREDATRAIVELGPSAIAVVPGLVQPAFTRRRILARCRTTRVYEAPERRRPAPSVMWPRRRVGLTDYAARRSSRSVPDCTMRICSTA